MSTEVAVYVNSFDGYSDIWETFFYIFKQFWSDCKYPVYLINNEKNFHLDGITVINTGVEKNWFYRTISSLEKVKEEYIIFLLEDYFFSKKIKNDDIENIIKYMENKNIFFYRLSDSNIKARSKDIIHVPNGTDYAVSLQPAVWNRRKLIHLLKTIDGKSPWDFEYYLNDNLKTDHKYYEGIVFDTRDILGYKNGVLRGKWIPETLQFYKRIGININTGERLILSKVKWYKYKLALITRKFCSRPVRKIIKSILKKLHINYV